MRYRFVSFFALFVVAYMSVIIVVHAQNRSDNRQDNAIYRLDDRTRLIEQMQASDTARVAELQREVHEIQSQRLDERISVIESTMATNLRLLIGLCLGMFPMLLDIARRWMFKQKSEGPHVDV